MKAAVLKELNCAIAVEDVDFDGPQAGEVLVKIAATPVSAIAATTPLPAI
jgi:Zn-dependent alcohol dehydrogenase